MRLARVGSVQAKKLIWKFGLVKLLPRCGYELVLHQDESQVVVLVNAASGFWVCHTMYVGSKNLDFSHRPPRVKEPPELEQLKDITTWETPVTPW